MRSVSPPVSSTSSVHHRTTMDVSYDAVSRRERERESAATRKKIRLLLDDVCNDDELKTDPSKLREVMGKSDKVLEEVKTTNEGKLEAMTFKQIASESLICSTQLRSPS